jgi:hypothetical protein
MKVKVHWIIDGIAEIEAENQVSAEKHVNEILSKLVQNNPEFTEVLGANALQGKAYFPGKAD